MTAEPEPDPPTAAEAEAAEAAAAIAADVAGLDLNARAWLRALKPVLELSSADPAGSPRVQFALEEMLVRACERAARILRSDLSLDDTDAS